MKQVLWTALLVLFTSLQTIAQEVKPIDTVILQKENVVGRWVEKARFNKINDSIPEQPYTYIFKEDQVFHKGTAMNDMLIFNIAGRFQVENDTIKIYYRDFLNRSSKENKISTMLFRIIAWSDKQMTAVVTASDFEEYTIVLMKQGS